MSDKNVMVIKEELSAEENTADTKSEIIQTVLIDVKIERESDSDVESQVYSCADHEIKEEKVVIELEPIYNYITNSSEDEPLSVTLPLETKDDETDDEDGVKPQKETEGNYCKENTCNVLCDIQSDTSDKPYLCSLCECKFIRKSDMKRHTRIHTGEKPYSCSMCEYKCTQKCNLTKHVRIHTGEKPYSCSRCDYKCTQKGDLTIHLRIHSGEKPYSCSFCKYKFSRKSILTKHVLRIHSGNSKILGLSGKTQ